MYRESDCVILIPLYLKLFYPPQHSPPRFQRDAEHPRELPPAPHPQGLRDCPSPARPAVQVIHPSGVGAAPQRGAPAPPGAPAPKGRRQIEQQQQRGPEEGGQEGVHDAGTQGQVEEGAGQDDHTKDTQSVSSVFVLRHGCLIGRF